MMNMVGIYESSVRSPMSNVIGWKILCEQEKTPYKVTSLPDCPVTVFDGLTPDWFEDYLKNGGIAVVTDCYPGLLPFVIDYIGDVSIENVDFSDLGSTLTRVQCLAHVFGGSGFGKIQIHENRVIKAGITQDEFPAVIYKSYGKGGCYYTGLPMPRLVTALGDTLRVSTTISDFSERVASVDRHHVLKAMRELLIMAFHQLGLPYVYLGYFPNAFQSAFTFRIDIDGVFGDNLLQISKSALENGIILTFFVNKSLCINDGDLIQQIDQDHEIGNHADIHNLFSDYDLNYRNILDCRAWLKNLGMDDNLSYSAPRGMWNPSLHKALDDLGFLYTSDFGVGISGFPFYPYINEKRSRTLQIPVNPFSSERAAVWRMEKENNYIDQYFIAESFLKIVEDNYLQEYPIMLYSHPEKLGPMAGYVFKKLDQKISELNIWRTTLTQFANWWDQRDKTNYSVAFDPSTNKTIIRGEINPDIMVKEI